MVMPPTSWEYRTVINVYSFFFAAFADPTDFYSELGELKGIESCVQPTLGNIPKDEYASFLAYMVDRGFFQQPYNDDYPDDGGPFRNDTFERANSLLSDVIMDALVERLEADSREEAVLFLEAFAYGQEVDLLLGNETISTPCADARSDKMQDVCERATDAECLRYCERVAQNRTRQALVKALLQDAWSFAGPLRPGNPQSLLPTCKFPDGEEQRGGGCWMRVVTDLGACFSTISDGGKAKLSDVGRSNAVELALDAGGRYYLDGWGTDGSYVVRVTAPHHHALGELVEREKVENGRYVPTAEGGAPLELSVTLDYVVEGTGDFVRMRPEKRNCLLSHESSLARFPSYSEPNCVLECAWVEAGEECGCLPWFLEGPPDADVDVCEAVGSDCFKEVVESRYQRRDSGPSSCYDKCLPDCDKVEYNVGWGHQEKEVVEETPVYSDYVAVNKTANAKSSVTAILDLFKKDHPSGNVGSIRLYVNKKTTLGIVMTATVTTIDMISNIGGTLGLFMGVSLLSGAELLFWMGKGVLGRK